LDFGHPREGVVSVQLSAVRNGIGRRQARLPPSREGVALIAIAIETQGSVDLQRSGTPHKTVAQATSRRLAA